MFNAADSRLRLHRYLTDAVHVDIYWFIGSRLDVAPSNLPRLDKPIHGSSTVPWRYHFNTGEIHITMIALFPHLTNSSDLLLYHSFLELGRLGAAT